MMLVKQNTMEQRSSRCSYTTTQNQFTGEVGMGGEPVKTFMQELKRYFVVTGLPRNAGGSMTIHFVTSDALLAWELEFEDVGSVSGPNTVTWEQFQQILLDQYDSLQPATEIRAAYDEMHGIKLLEAHRSPELWLAS